MNSTRAMKVTRSALRSSGYSELHYQVKRARYRGRCHLIVKERGRKGDGPARRLMVGAGCTWAQAACAALSFITTKA